MTGTPWDPSDSEELYSLPAWGLGLVRVDDRGQVVVHPDPDAPERRIAIPRLLEDLRRRGIHPPLLLRFNDLLRCRVRQLFDCFEHSIRASNYRGRYRGVYPIKVNQQRHVVETLLEAGRQRGLGLEVGSKPELLAALALLRDSGLLVCNGVKDHDYLRTALWSRRLGLETIVVVERLDELPALLDVAEADGLEPLIGLRAKLATRGAGRWEGSGGDRSKFGLDAVDLVRAVEVLRERGRLGSLQLLHFHIGSQVTGIANLEAALQEGARLFVELHRLGAPLRLFDVGGGLGVDYDGTRSPVDVSVDYTDQEYANDVVGVTRKACDEAGVPHPDLITESGRSLVAHQSVLVVEVTGSSERPLPETLPELAEDAHRCLRDLRDAAQGCGRSDLTEEYHNVRKLLGEVRSLFNHGILGLRERAVGEELARNTLRKILASTRVQDDPPEALRELETELASTLYCNFSVFQSLPDHWAIAQRFPVLPLDGLDRRPDTEVTLADLTCDSDGKVDSFIGGNPRRTLRVHHSVSRGSHLGFFLVGAYQEILGDLHNLFGDTAAVHVDLDEEGYRLSHFVEADRICEILHWVDYPRSQLLDTLRHRVEDAVRRDALSPEQAAGILDRYAASLEATTYPRPTTSDGNGEPRP